MTDQINEYSDEGEHLTIFKGISTDRVGVEI